MGTLHVSIRAVAALAAAWALSGCFEGSTGGSETTNGLSGWIRDGEGRPAKGSEVTLVPADYHPVPGRDLRILRRTRADLSGRYRFAGIEPGAYNLEARDSARDLMLLLRGVDIGPTRDSMTRADGILESTGALQIPFADRALPAGALAYLRGTTWYAPAKLGEGDMVALVRLPPGLLPELKLGFADSAADLPYALADSIAIEPAKVAVMGPVQAWRHSRALRWNSPPGAAADSLRGLPVLLRLGPGDFDFSQARPDGRDLRFFRSGIRLPHQVEHWDPAGGTAAVWIRMDSLEGNTGDTSVTLHWGREDALEGSSGAAVFEGAAGFTTVWHLGEAGNTAAGGYRDAAASGAHATAATSDPGSRITAPIGFGKRFGEDGSGLTASLPKGLGGDASFSVSFWMDFGAAVERQNILWFGRDTMLQGFHFLIRNDTTAQIGPFDQTADALPSARQNAFSLKPWLGHWTHVATVYDAGAGKLSTYVNGELQATNDLSGLQIEIAPGVRVGSSLPAGSSKLAETGFQGALDEVRFYTRPISAAWIRAEYEASKEGSAWLTLK